MVNRFVRRVSYFGLVWLLGIGFPAPARADKLDELKARGILRWGGDQEGGAPFIFQDREGLRGFEIELAEMIAAELGVKAEFRQGQWGDVPKLLDNGEIDIAMNGYERTEARVREYLCSRPYYLYGLQLLVPRGKELQSWSRLDDLHPPRKYRIGVLGESAAEFYLTGKYAHSTEMVPYQGATEAMSDAVEGRLDGTLQDDCVMLHYADRFPKLQFVGRPVGSGYYVILMNRNEHRLRQAIDAALHAVIDDGRLKKLYDRWDMSGRFQMLSLRDVTEIKATARPAWWELLRDYSGLLLSGAGMTVLLSVASFPLAIALGIAIAVGRLYGPKWLGYGLAWYVEIIRGTPLMLQLYAIYFVLPEFGIHLPAFAAAVAGLALNYSAYEAEIYRAGIQAIPRGQMEAALALGMSRWEAIRRIILPQAWRLVIPPVTNDFVALFKDTSVCSVVTVVELTKRYNILANGTGATIEMAILAALLYMAMSWPLSVFARESERRLAVDR